MTNTSFSEIEGKRVIILGDVGTGKTSLVRRLLIEAIEKYLKDLTVIDMAPPRMSINGETIGGHLLEKPDQRVRYLAPKEVWPPRLKARDPEELISLAEKNREEIEVLLATYSKEPSEILFVNDVSIYLQRGDIETLWGALSKARTLVVNSYFGERLSDDHGTGISTREKNEVLALAERMDMVIRL